MTVTERFWKLIHDWIVIDGKWHHVAIIVYKSGKGVIYVDGEKTNRIIEQT